MKRLYVPVTAAVLILTLTGCVRVKRPLDSPTAAPAGATLWRAPARVSSLDLYYGPWGAEYAPDPNAVYKLLRVKHSGVNTGMDVVDPLGREWSVKQDPPGGVDPEGPVEVTVSRLLSASGYFQPPVYYLPAFTLKDDFGTRTEIGGRFRLELESLKEVDSWSWQENPFLRSQPYQGLLVLMMMFNATDLKNSNNSLYEVQGDEGGLWYLPRDLGAALGDTDRLTPRKGHIDSFERHPFITGVKNGYVEFAYRGWYRKLVHERITPQDVVWASERLGALSDTQLADAFRAGGFTPDETSRFVSKLREKIQQGRALGQPARGR